MRLLFLAFFLWSAVPSSAQHLCGTDFHTVEAREALAAFQAARKAGTLPRVAAKSMTDPEIGDQKVFNVSESAWTPLTFELRAKSESFYIWADLAELANGNVTQGEIDRLADAFGSSTPAGSIDPTRGILDNNTAIFGDMPNYDGDGKLDIVLYNIAPDQDNASSFTVGYVTSADLNPGAPSGVGNQADVLYLDSFQGTDDLEDLEAIAAHELTHLIHFTYDFDPETFISEGVAEYAMVMNGYARWRGISYLSNPAEYRIPLFTWRDDAGPGLADYQRSGLFMSYMAERVGPERTGEIVRMVNKGSPGIDSLLVADGLSLAEVSMDFHTANLLRDTSIGDGRFGYTRPFRSFSSVVTNPRYSGSGALRTPEVMEGDEPLIEGLAVEYVEFTDVSELRVRLDGYLNPTVASIPVIGPQLLAEVRTRIRGRVVTEDRFGGISLTDVASSETPVLVSGDHPKAWMLISSGIADKLTYYTFDAEWGTATPTDVETDGLLPDSPRLSAPYPNPFNPSTQITYSLPATMRHRVVVHDALGRAVATLVDGVGTAGPQSVGFDAGDLPNGIYLVTLEAGSVRDTRTAILLK